jgi:predicted MFS family arabinose efflux permease
VDVAMSLGLAFFLCAAGPVASIAQTSLIAAAGPLPTTSLAGANLASSVGKALGAGLGGALLLAGGYGWVGGGLGGLVLVSLLLVRGASAGGSAEVGKSSPVCS